MSGTNYSVTILGPAPWGFRLHGGKDFSLPLTISRLADGGKAAKAGLSVGDAVLSIDGISTDGMNHLEAQNKIKSCSGNLNLNLQKASSVSKPTVAPKSSVYNTPINLYSNENACEVAMGQRRGLLESQGGATPEFNGGPHSILNIPPRKHVVETDIHFYHVPSHGDASKKRIMEDTEDWRPRTGTTQSRSFRILAQITGTEQEQPQHQESEDGKKTKVKKVNIQIGPKYKTLRDWHHGVSARTLNVHTPLLAETLSGQVSSPLPPPDGGGVSVEPQASETSAGHGGDDDDVRDEDPTSPDPVPSPVSSVHRRELLANPLDFLPRGAPPPPPLTPSAPTQPIQDSLAAVYSTLRARSSPPKTPSPDGRVSQSLLDAMLITPIAEAPPLRLRKKKRRSLSALHLPQNKRVSWHQSVTDLGDPSLSSPVNAVYIFSEEIEESELGTHESSSVKTMTKGPATTQGLGVPKPGLHTGLITPSFGMRGNGTALPKGPVPPRPAPQPHPEDEASLVQMAEHIPAGTRTPMCANCDRVIRGPFLVAMGKSWHPDEFNCAHCRSSLADVGFVEERGSEGSVYCEHCYEEFLAPTCGRCQQKILGEVINALKQTWHVYCFLCASCQQPIRNNTFHMEDGEPYCERDYYNLFGTGCHGCEFPIEAGDRFLEALGFTWHDTCFVCAVCCTTLEGQTFFSKKDKPLCKKHAHTLRI